MLSHIYLNHFHIFWTIILLFHALVFFRLYNVQFPQRNHDILPVIRIWIQFFFSTELAYCHFDGCNDDIPVKWPVSLDLQSIYPRSSKLYLWGKVTLTSIFTLFLTYFVFYQESPGFQWWNLYFPKKSILYTLKWDIVGVIAVNICWDIN